MRYVDDVRQFTLAINKGWRWNSSLYKFEFSQKWLKLDLENQIPDDKRTAEVLVQAMNDVMPFLEFTSECQSDFPDNRLPTLDCNLFVSNGRILHTFFEKSMRCNKSIDAKSALPALTIRSSLRQEIVRRMINLHLDLPHEEKLKVLDQFYDKLRLSGHDHEVLPRNLY